MKELNEKILGLHNYLDQLFKWSNSINTVEKERSKQLFSDLWLMDIEILQFLSGEELPEWID